MVGVVSEDGHPESKTKKKNTSSTAIMEKLEEEKWSGGCGCINFDEKGSMYLYERREEGN